MMRADGHAVSTSTVQRALRRRGLLLPRGYRADRKSWAVLRRKALQAPADPAPGSTPARRRCSLAAFRRTAFHRTWAAVFGSEHPLEPELAHEHWTALTRDDPRATASRAVLSYIKQRARRADQLTATLTAATPTQFLWGLADPVSGHLIADALRHGLDNPNLTECPRVGHIPPSRSPT
jgi:pimeloyl-ACP methyl ester carboxylesterase